MKTEILTAVMPQEVLKKRLQSMRFTRKEMMDEELSPKEREFKYGFTEAINQLSIWQTIWFHSRRKGKIKCDNCEYQNKQMNTCWAIKGKCNPRNKNCDYRMKENNK